MSCRENDLVQSYKTSDLEKIKMALNENPKLNAIELVKKTGLPARTIINFLNDGTLTAIDEPRKKNIKGYYVTKDAHPEWHIDIKHFSKR